MRVTVADAGTRISETVNVGATLLPYSPPFVITTDEIDPLVIIGASDAGTVIDAPPPVAVIDAVLL
jgi:hypothetical protein